MNAKEFARYVFDLMDKAGYPYMSPELSDDMPGVPPTIQVWDADMSMIRLIAFADDESDLPTALQYARDVIPTLEHPEYYWPEAWWQVGNARAMIEGWEDASPIDE